MKNSRLRLLVQTSRSLLACLCAAPPVLLGLGLLLAVSVPSTHATSSPPESMTYQGYLVDANGNPLATNNPANYPVIFRIYSAATGGARLWSEQQIVTVDKGSFSVVLGEGTVVGGEVKPSLSSVFTGTTASDRFISISVTIGSSTLEILPRLRLLPAPYAFLATSAANLITPGGANAISYANNRVEIEGALRVSGSSIPSLTLDSSSPVGTWLALGNSAGGRYWQMISTGSGNGGGAGNLIFATGTIPNSTSGTPLVIQPDGDIGIGTLTPNAPLSFGSSLANTKLALWDGGPGAAYGFGIQGGQFRFHINTAADRFSFLNGQAGTEIVTIQGSGNVGIGESSPGSKLVVAGGIRAFGGPPGPFGNNNTGYAFTGNGGDNDSGMFSSADGQVEFYVNNSERMRIHSNGNVGIGTGIPTSLLQLGSVAGTGDAFLRMESVGGNQAANGIKLRNFNDQHGFDLINEERNGAGLQANGFHIIRHSSDAVGQSALFINKNNGFMGLGTTTPGDRLHLRGGVFRIDDAGNRYIQMYRSVNGFIISGNSMSQQGGGVGTIQWDGDGNWDSLSDRRLKKDISDAEPVMARVMQLPVRRYRWKESPDDADKKFGVIAQEVQPLFPESVGVLTRPGATEESLTVKYGTFGLIAVKALQELKKEKDTEQAAFRREIDDLKQDVALLKGRLAKTASVDALEAELASLKEIVHRLAAQKDTKTAAANIDEGSAATRAVSSSRGTVAAR